MALLAEVAAFIWSGACDIAVDEQHSPPVHSMLQSVSERSNVGRTDDLVVPSDPSDRARIRQVAGNCLPPENVNARSLW